MYETSSKRNWVHFKFVLMKLLKKYRQVMSLKLFSKSMPLLYVILMIEGLENLRKVLLQSLSLGKEETIPLLISTEKFPSSLKWYDPTLAYVNENMDEYHKENLNNKRNQVAKTIIESGFTYRQLQGEKKLFSKQYDLNEKYKPCEYDINNNPMFREIQSSN